MKFTPMTAERFWSKVDKTGGPEACWPYKGFINKGGYGVVTVNYRNMPAHRAAYSFEKGLIPNGMNVCHSCDFPSCCNPSHLFLGTQKQNMADMVLKNRQSQGESHSKAILPGRKRGESHYANRFTEDNVRKMIELYAGGSTVVEIAKQYGTTRSTVQKIVYRQTWKHLDIPKPAPQKFSKLTEEDVLLMRSIRKNLGTSIKDLAFHFGVTVWTANDIVYRRTWKHI